MKKYIWYKRKLGQNEFIDLDTMRSVSFNRNQYYNTQEDEYYVSLEAVLKHPSPDILSQEIVLDEVSQRVFKAYGHHGIGQLADMVSIEFVKFLNDIHQAPVFHLNEALIECERLMIVAIQEAK